MKVASFFAGCGGLDLGFEQAGFNVIWANDFDGSVEETYLHNHPQTQFVLGDINSIKPEEIPDCDGFIGGPPCQSWSVAGKQRGLEDERGKLFLTYIELIRAKKPKFFLIENVKGLLDEMFKDVFTMFLDKLKESGYDVKWELLDAVDYGVPQNRERVFIVGLRNDLNVNYEFPGRTCHEPNTLMVSIGDIKEEPVFFKASDKIIENNRLLNHDVINANFNQFYYRGNRRRGWQQPSFTIHATAINIPLHPSSPKMLFFGHENWAFQKDLMKDYRRLSVRECARIQTFPDWFNFKIDKISAAYKMIGNAVPPMLGKILATSIMSALKQCRYEQEGMNNSHVSDNAVLVGYYKNQHHHDCIMKNRLYNVRSDGRKGSIFKDDCDVIPKYLCLHHKNVMEIYELENEEPILVDASFLRTLGFESSGNRYLCFRLKNNIAVNPYDLSGDAKSRVAVNTMNYVPYVTSLEEIIVDVEK